MKSPLKVFRQHVAWNSSRFHWLLLWISISGPCAQAAFIKVQGIDDTRIRRVVVSDRAPAFMAVASENSLYLSHDSGQSFRKASVLKDEQINDIYIGNGDGEPLLMAGSRNGYRVGQAIERIFSTMDGEQLNFLAGSQGVLYAGTSLGLYQCNQTLLNWSPVVEFKNDSVNAMTPSGNDLYIASNSGVYLYSRERPLKRLFIARGSDSGEGLIPYRLQVDVMTPSRLWLCTSRGVFRSDDYGDSWQKFYLNGSGNAAAYCLTQFPLDGNHFYLCSAAGFYKVDTTTGGSTALYEGLPTTNILWAELTASGEMYLATDQGLFRQALVAAAKPAARGLADIMQGEPAIQDVQRAAMRYNAVDAGKTASWRKRIKFRALLPKFSVDYDKTIGSSYTSSGYYYGQGPYDWGVSLTWDMGDLIWNTYEDDIDNRSKLTTQLRMDILDEVNRLYFERLRLKHEIETTRTSGGDTTLKELRLYELTATLDGYTGGLYSRTAAMEP